MNAPWKNSTLSRPRMLHPEISHTFRSDLLCNPRVFKQLSIVRFMMRSSTELGKREREAVGSGKPLTLRFMPMDDTQTSSALGQALQLELGWQYAGWTPFEEKKPDGPGLLIYATTDGPLKSIDMEGADMACNCGCFFPW